MLISDTSSTSRYRRLSKLRRLVRSCKSIGIAHDPKREKPIYSLQIELHNECHVAAKRTVASGELKNSQHGPFELRQLSPLAEAQGNMSKDMRMLTFALLKQQANVSSLANPERTCHAESFYTTLRLYCPYGPWIKAACRPVLIRRRAWTRSLHH